MRFTSDRQRKAVMASLNTGGSKASASVPFPRAPLADTTYKRSTKRMPRFSMTEPMSEQDVKLILRRANATHVRPDMGDIESQPLTQAQQDKAITWMRKRTFGKSGIKDSSEFREREADVFDPTKPKPVVSLKDFYPDYNPYTKQDYFYPLYEVSGNGGSFEYYVKGGKVNIIG